MDIFASPLTYVISVAFGLVALVLFLIAEKRIGFTIYEAIAILFLSFLLGFIEIPLIVQGNTTLLVNVGGAIIPAFLGIYLIHKNRIYVETFAGIVVVVPIAYLCSHIGENGVAYDFPLFIFPAMATALCAIIIEITSKRDGISPYIAYSVGVFSILIGGDLLRFGKLMQSGATQVVIGGGSIVDMVYITGIMAIIIDILIHREVENAAKKII